MSFSTKDQFQLMKIQTIKYPIISLFIKEKGISKSLKHYIWLFIRQAQYDYNSSASLGSVVNKFKLQIGP